MGLTLKAINDELAKRGYTARLAKSTGYFYFQFGEAVFWLDRTVNVPTLESLTLPEWITEFELLRRFNRKLTPRHRNDQNNVVQRATTGLRCPRLADWSNPSNAVPTPARKTRDKNETPASRLKKNKGN
jgi:hypothetical protein